MDLSTHLEAERAHTQKLAALPGWRDYIEHKANGMARKYPELYADLPALVAATPLLQDGAKETAINQEKRDDVRTPG